MRHILSPRVGRPIHNHIAHAPRRTAAGGVGPAHGSASGPLDERLLSRFRARELPGMRPQMPKLDRRHPSKIRPVSTASPPRRVRMQAAVSPRLEERSHTVRGGVGRGGVGDEPDVAQPGASQPPCDGRAGAGVFAYFMIGAESVTEIALRFCRSHPRFVS
jgi:hypothetical protein